MGEDKLERWEKWPTAALYAASGFYILLWYIGDTVDLTIGPIVPWLYFVFGLAAMASVEGAMVAAIAGARNNRRSIWTIGTIISSAVFNIGVALHAHHAIPEYIGAWLHAGFAVTSTMYLLHLSQPRAAGTLASEVARLKLEIDQRDDELSRQRNELERARNQAAAVARELGAARDALQAERARVPMLPEVDSDVVVQIAGRSYSLSNIGEAFELPRSTVAYRLKKLEEVSK